MCDGEGGCEREANLHALDLIRLPGIHRDGSHEADGWDVRVMYEMMVKCT